MPRYSASSSELPDPQLRPEFYSGIVAKRLAAWAVDVVIIAVLTLLVLALSLFLTIFMFPLVWLTIEAMYRIVTLSNRSATLGQRLLAIEMRDRHGRHFDRSTAAWHTLAYLGTMVFMLPQLVSVVLMLTSPRGQSLADTWLGTAAINRPAR